MTKEKLYKELHECCEALKKLRKKYAHKRSGYISLPRFILKKKYKLWIPNKYENGKRPKIVEAIYLLKQRAYLMGRLEEIRKHDERNK